mgnify:CR=1 FL=1
MRVRLQFQPKDYNLGNANAARGVTMFNLSRVVIAGLALSLLGLSAAFADEQDGTNEADYSKPADTRGVQIEMLAPSVTLTGSDAANMAATVEPASPTTPAKRNCIALPGQTTDLTLNEDPSQFDKLLKAKLKNDPEQVLITFSSPQSSDDLPETIQPWLSEIETTGGEISLAPIQCARTRGVFAWMKKRIMLLFGIQPSNTYEAMKDYHATLYYDEEEELVRQILFARRTGNS